MNSPSVVLSPRKFSSVLAFAAVGVAGLFGASGADAVPVTPTVTSTSLLAASASLCGSSSRTWTVPAGITRIKVTLVGGAGGTGGADGPAGAPLEVGANGGLVSGLVSVSAGDTVTYYVGCNGSNGITGRSGNGGAGGVGFGTGGAGGKSGTGGVSGGASGSGGGGGGSTALLVGTKTIVAGGGGGGAGSGYRAYAKTGSRTTVKGSDWDLSGLRSADANGGVGTDRGDVDGGGGGGGGAGYEYGGAGGGVVDSTNDVFGINGNSGDNALAGLATLSASVATTAGGSVRIDWAPVPSVSGAPTGLTNSTTASITLSGESGSTFNCSVDGGAYAPCTSPFAPTGLADGTHSVSVTQTTAAGVTSEPVTTNSWTVDATAPDAPVLSGAPSSLTQSTSASISFTGESGATFTCSVDGGAYVPCSSPQNFSGLADGVHSLSVKATDAAGNTSDAGSASWTVDTTPPDAPVLSGAPSSLTNGTSASISFTGESGATFTCSVDGGAYVPCSSPQDFSGLADGPHSLSVKATDAAGNTSNAGSASWTVDTTPPAAPVLSGAPSAVTTSTSSNVSFTGEAGATFTCSVDGGAYAPCSSPQVFSGLADGPHSLSVKATDAAGNTSSAGSASWTVDATAPDAPVLSGAPSSLTNSTSASISFTGESGATFTCSVDGGAYVPCSSPQVFSGLADGPHSLSVKATDAAGNTSNAGSASWTVDATPPAAPVVKGTATGLTTSTSSDVSFTGESGATLTCSVDGGAYAPCTSPVSLSGLGLGAHSVSVKATDAAGNTSEAGTVQWTIYAAPVPCGTPERVQPALGVFVPVATSHVANRWVLAVGASFTRGWDTRGCADLLSVQISTSRTQPSDAQPIATFPSYAQGIRAWDTTVSRASRAKPTWVRVGNKAGKWSPWLATGPAIDARRAARNGR